MSHPSSIMTGVNYLCKASSTMQDEMVDEFWLPVCTYYPRHTWRSCCHFFTHLKWLQIHLITFKV